MLASRMFKGLYNRGVKVDNEVMKMEGTNVARRKTIHTFIGLGIMIILGLLPGPEPITALGMKALGLFIGTVYLWITVDLLWPSIFAIMLYAFIGYTNIAGAISMSLGNDTFWQAILMMAILGLMGQCGVTDHIVSGMMSFKILKGRPWIFSFGFLIVLIIIVSLTNSLLGVLLCLQILVSVRDVAGFKNGDSWLHLMAVGVVYFGAIAGCLIPFRGLMLYLINILTKAGVTGVDFLSFMLMSFPTALAMLILFVLMMRFVFRCDVTPLKNFDPAVLQKDLGPMTKQQIALILVFLAYLITLTFAPYLPKTSWLYLKYSSIGVAGVAMIIFCVCHIVHIDGKPIGDFQQVVHTVPWGMMFMIAVAMSVSNVLLSDDTGIKAYMMTVLQPVFTGKSAFVFSALFVLLAIILTNVSNNMVVAFVFTPLAIAFNAVEPIALITTVSLLCFAVNFALILPSGSPTAALLFSHEFGAGNRQRHFLYTIATCIMGYLVMMFVAYPLGMFFMGN